jgi:hypothetical protein
MVGSTPEKAGILQENTDQIMMAKLQICQSYRHTILPKQSQEAWSPPPA